MQGIGQKALKGLRHPDLLRGGSLVDRQWLDGGARMSVADPATGAEVASVAMREFAQVDRAVDAAQRAFEAWRSCLTVERGRRWTQRAALIRGQGRRRLLRPTGG